MNIKEAILEHVLNEENFAYTSIGSREVEKFRNFTQHYLMSKTYAEAERRARLLINFILCHHEKSYSVGPVLEIMNNFELYGDFEYEKQRLHYCHQLNVFLLGLFLFHNYPALSKEILNEMERTTVDTNLQIEDDYVNWRYSGGKASGEFLYRWRLCALAHDLGYGISLFGKDSNKIKEALDEISSYINSAISSLDELNEFDGKDLLESMSEKISEVDIVKYFNYQKMHPYKGVVAYDHGIVSSIIFLRLMYEEYYRHRNNKITEVNDYRVIWHDHILRTSIIEVAKSIALHNLDKYDSCLQKSSADKKMFNLEKNPLAWLLKIADILQEWDKPLAKGSNLNEKILRPNMEIRFDNNCIYVKNFPEVDDAKKRIENYTLPGNIIIFE